MHSTVAFACCFLVFSSTTIARQLTGAVYSDHSGPSGHGTGEVLLATSVGLISIHYQKPIQHRFSNDRCWQLGAIWTVRTDGGRGAEELITARCNGAVDAPVNFAWSAVLEYIKTIALHAGHELGFQLNKRGPIIVNFGAVDVDVSGYLDFPGDGMCLEMKQRVSNSAIVIASSADCYFIPDIDFTVERLGAAAWRVTHVKAVNTR